VDGKIEKNFYYLFPLIDKIRPVNFSALNNEIEHDKTHVDESRALASTREITNSISMGKEKTVKKVERIKKNPVIP
jgi:hypothetical protein